MADTKISALANASALGGTEQIPGVQSAANVNITPAQIKTYVVASPTLVTPNLGTPSAGVLTSCTGLPVSTGISGLGTGVATALAVNVGSAGAPVLFNGAGGTPSSLTLTNATGLVATTGLTATGTKDSTTFLRGDNTWAVPAGGSPGGSTTQIQYNNAGAFGGSNIYVGTNVFDVRNGVNAQAFNVYNTYTDASNYERAAIGYSSNVFVIDTQKAGTGVNRNISFRINGTEALKIDSGNGAVTSAYALRVTGTSGGATNGGVGYQTGAGGTVTQATSRTTGVTLNSFSGAITLVSAAGSTSWQTFTVTNSTVSATDTVIVSQKSGTDKNMIFVTAVAAGSFDITFATTGGTTTEQPVFNFAVIKGAAS